MFWILPAIFVLVHSPQGDQPRAYEGNSLEQIQSAVLSEGKTFDLLTRQQYEALLAANAPTAPTPAELVAAFRAQASSATATGGDWIGQVIRAVALVMNDANNVVRQRDADRAADIAAAASLADLKTRAAARPSLDPITPTQVKNAIINKINAGAAD